MKGATVEMFNTIQFIRPNQAEFERCRAQSIDYAVMEKHNSVAVVPFKSQWSDVGSWRALAELTDADEENNRIMGGGIAYKSKSTFIHAPHRPVVALGVDDLLIIDSPDAVLVAHKHESETLKDVVALLDAKGIKEAHTHQRVGRPWGRYESIANGEGFQVKIIGVRPKARLSLQLHHCRAEHWVVVSGKAEVTCGEKIFLLH